MVARKTPRRVLVIDVGGTHVKLRSDVRGSNEEFVSGPKMTPGGTRHVREPVKGSACDLVKPRTRGPG